MLTRPSPRSVDAMAPLRFRQQTAATALQQGRHALYGAALGGTIGGIVGIVASNACKGGLCQDERVSVTLAAAGFGAFVGAISGWFVPVRE